MRKRLSREQLGATKGVLGPVATVTLPTGEKLEPDIISMTGPLGTVPRFSQDGLDKIAGQNLLQAEFFKSLRAREYTNEWKMLAALPDVGSREWKMIALSFCAQVAVEARLIYPFLVTPAHDWLRQKFAEQCVIDHFEERWDAYLEHCGEALHFLEGSIYLRVAGRLRFTWFGDPPNCLSSLKYRLITDDNIV